eukprot:Platyproteum_vivax@DN4519_c0_g1_i1.p1
MYIQVMSKDSSNKTTEESTEGCPQIVVSKVEAQSSTTSLRRHSTRDKLDIPRNPLVRRPSIQPPKDEESDEKASNSEVGFTHGQLKSSYPPEAPPKGFLPPKGFMPP